MAQCTRLHLCARLTRDARLRSMMHASATKRKASEAADGDAQRASAGLADATLSPEEAKAYAALLAAQAAAAAAVEQFRARHPGVKDKNPAPAEEPPKPTNPNTKLLDAAKSGNVAAAREALDSGAEVNCKDEPVRAAFTSGRQAAWLLRGLAAWLGPRGAAPERGNAASAA